MHTFKKSEFEKTNNIEEFVDSEGGMIGGDRNVHNNDEIETGPVQKDFKDNSDYEKGVSTTTDRASRYRQEIPWFAVYSYGRSRTGTNAVSENSKLLTKKSVEEKVDDLVKRKLDNELTDKNYNAKLAKILEIIDENNFSDEQLSQITTAITNKKGNQDKKNI